MDPDAAADQQIFFNVFGCLPGAAEYEDVHGFDVHGFLQPGDAVVSGDEQDPDGARRMDSSSEASVPLPPQVAGASREESSSDVDPVAPIPFPEPVKYDGDVGMYKNRRTAVPVNQGAQDALIRKLQTAGVDVTQLVSGQVRFTLGYNIPSFVVLILEGFGVVASGQQLIRPDESSTISTISLTHGTPVKQVVKIALSVAEYNRMDGDKVPVFYSGSAVNMSRSKGQLGPWRTPGWGTMVNSFVGAAGLVFMFHQTRQTDGRLLVRVGKVGEGKYALLVTEPWDKLCWCVGPLTNLPDSLEVLPLATEGTGQGICAVVASQTALIRSGEHSVCVGQKSRAPHPRRPGHVRAAGRAIDGPLQNPLCALTGFRATSRNKDPLKLFGVNLARFGYTRVLKVETKTDGQTHTRTYREKDNFVVTEKFDVPSHELLNGKEQVPDGAPAPAQAGSPDAGSAEAQHPAPAGAVPLPPPVAVATAPGLANIHIPDWLAGRPVAPTVPAVQPAPSSAGTVVVLAPASPEEKTTKEVVQCKVGTPPGINGPFDGLGSLDESGQLPPLSELLPGQAMVVYPSQEEARNVSEGEGEGEASEMSEGEAESGLSEDESSEMSEDEGEGKAADMSEAGARPLNRQRGVSKQRRSLRVAKNNPRRSGRPLAREARQALEARKAKANKNKRKK